MGSSPTLGTNNMKKLDLHGKDYKESKFLVNIFIEKNLDCLPIKIITGNSNKMKKIVEEAIYKKNLNCDYQNHHNLGSLIITEKY